jgi:hypothetical protein
MSNESDKIRERERRENEAVCAAAIAAGKAVTFIATDGCEVTVLPNGTVFHNAAYWW